MKLYFINSVLNKQCPVIGGHNTNKDKHRYKKVGNEFKCFLPSLVTCFADPFCTVSPTPSMSWRCPAKEICSDHCTSVDALARQRQETFLITTMVSGHVGVLEMLCCINLLLLLLPFSSFLLSVTLSYDVQLGSVAVLAVAPDNETPGQVTG